ncbi:hypothetical protein [Enterococcus cecorum]|uniref:hypothetical protein n=4 Tax=Enterococcus cecorum TaxID=44008 RepID=UPI0032C46AE2
MKSVLRKYPKNKKNKIFSYTYIKLIEREVRLFMLNDTLFTGILIFGILLTLEFCLNILPFADFMVYLTNGRRESQKSKTDFHLIEYLEKYSELKYQKMKAEKAELEVINIAIRYGLYKGILSILWGLVQGLGWSVIFSAIPNEDKKMVAIVFFTGIFVLCFAMWIRVIFSPNKLKRAIYIQVSVFLAFIYFDSILRSSISFKETYLYLILYFYIYLIYILLQIYSKKVITNQRKFIYQTFIKYWYRRGKEYRDSVEYSNRFNVIKKLKTEKWGFRYWPIVINFQTKEKNIWLSEIDK